MSHTSDHSESSRAARTSASPEPTKPSATSRRLKVHYKGPGHPKPFVPALRIHGRWLERAGFVIGRHVKVEVGERRLTIEQID